MALINYEQPHHKKPSEEQALSFGDPLDKISEEMAERGFATLWTQQPKRPSTNTNRLSFNDKAKTLYLRKLATTGRASYSAASAGVALSTINRHRAKDPVFDIACNEALEYFRDLLQGELIRRGVEGYEEEVLGGKNRDQVFKLTKYSDKCLELVSKIHIAQINRDAVSLQVIDNSQHNVVSNSFDLSTMSAEDLTMFKKLVQNQALKAEEEAKQLEKVIPHE